MPVEREAWLAWVADGIARRVRARLLDISRIGAAVEVDVDPDTDVDVTVPRNRPFLFGLGASPENAVFLGATIVAIATPRPAVYRLHVAFTTECPGDLLKRALYGRHAGERRPLLAALASAAWSFAERARRAVF
jgi:hypothetical protein